MPAHIPAVAASLMGKVYELYILLRFVTLASTLAQPQDWTNAIDDSPSAKSISLCLPFSVRSMDCSASNWKDLN